MRITLKDIANKTGLSITSVSLILNNRPNKISQKTKDLVIKTAKEMGYHPNQLAISLIKRRTNTIGLIVPDIRNSFFSLLAKGIEDACQQNGWTMILCNTSDNVKRDTESIRVLLSKGVDGIIYCMSMDGARVLPEILKLFNDFSVPFVMIDRFVPSIPVPVVTLNHEMGGLIAGNYLISLGHRKIACITGPSNLEDSRLRLKGFKRALKENNIEFKSDLLIEGDYHMESGMTAVKKLQGKVFTAIFAFNDMMAFGACKYLRDQGLSIPDDISVIGYDDNFFSELMEVPLTTIHQPIEKAGSSATKALIEAIESGKAMPSFTTDEPKLIIRKSTAAPNKNK